MAWHSDSSWGLNPGATTFITILDLPEIEGDATGGDTLFPSQVQAYEHLSPPFQKFLKTLWDRARMCSRQVAISAANRFSRFTLSFMFIPSLARKPFLAMKLTPSIIGLKREESDCILRLFEFGAKSSDLQIRAIKWEKGMVVVNDSLIVLTILTEQKGGTLFV